MSLCVRVCACLIACVELLTPAEIKRDGKRGLDTCSSKRTRTLSLCCLSLEQHACGSTAGVDGSGVCFQTRSASVPSARGEQCTRTSLDKQSEHRTLPAPPGRTTLSLTLFLSLSISLYLSVSLSLPLSVSLSVSLSLCLSLSLSFRVFLFVSISLSPSLSLFLSPSAVAFAHILSPFLSFSRPPFSPPLSRLLLDMLPVPASTSLPPSQIGRAHV